MEAGRSFEEQAGLDNRVLRNDAFGMGDHEMFRFVEWPFLEGRFPRHLGAAVMRSVLSGDRPALQVTHFPEGDWAVADGDGDPNAEGALTVTHMWHVLELDPTLEELASLPPGYVADRTSVGEAWVVSEFEYEHEP
ncbi:MAG TPA: hypothetical protein VGC98_05715 [Thermoleophilaceae bacterium]|jgi:hypothetical protein